MRVSSYPTSDPSNPPMPLPYLIIHSIKQKPGNVMCILWNSSSSPYRSRTAYYGVFDGHAGPRASKFTAEHLHKNIVAKFPKGESKL